MEPEAARPWGAGMDRAGAAKPARSFAVGMDVVEAPSMVGRRNGALTQRLWLWGHCANLGVLGFGTPKYESGFVLRGLLCDPGICPCVYVLGGFQACWERVARLPRCCLLSERSPDYP